MMKKLLTAFLVCLSITSQGAELVWLNLEPKFSYMDILTACSNSPYKVFMFGAELENLRPVRAVLRERGVGSLAGRIVFTEAELQGVQFQSDSKGRTWVTRLPLSPRMIAWVAQHGDGMFECKPTSPLATVVPMPTPFLFPIENAGEFGFFIDSQVELFKGKTAKGGAYQLKLSFTQTTIQ